MTMTNALILSGDGRVRQRRMCLGEPRATQVRVKVEVVGICATDLALYHGRYQAPHCTPICFGHEWAGVVEAAGEDVEHLRPGDRVTGECSLWCGTCDRCRRNLNLCQRIEKFGITVDGAAREHILIEARYLHRSVRDLDPAVLALSEPLAVCHQGLLAAGFHRDIVHPRRVLIIGAGMLGQACALLLTRMFGCTQIFLHDREPARLDRAKPFGVHVLHDLLADVRSDTGYASLYSNEQFDLVIETTGAAAALQSGLAHLNAGGTLVMLGFLDRVEITPKDLVIKAGRIVGSIGGSDSFEAIVPWLATHAEEAKNLISHSFPADRAAEAFTAAGDVREALKVQVRFS